MKYDDSEYYFLEFTTDLPTEYGGRHMALFLDWAVRRGLASAPLMQHAEALRRGDIAALDLLFDACDGKLTPEDLNDEGNAFARRYYASGEYIEDFVECCERGGVIDDSDAAWERLCTRLDARLRGEPPPPAPAPWWAFWRRR